MAKDFDIHNCDFESLYKEAEETKTTEIALTNLTAQTNKYTFKKVVGQGGVKRVSHMYDNFARRDVAMAELIDNENQQALDQFIKEAWLTAQLDHPNIIKVYEVGTKENRKPFFTMELKTGQSLKTVSENVVDEALDIFIKICHAVSYAHSKNILHLDLKPENIQIGSFGEVLVCDWGMGRLIKIGRETDPEKVMLYAELRKSALVHEKNVAGTPGFMAPEQFSKNSELTAKTDIFGLGALLYQLLTGHPPFNGTLEEIKTQTISGSCTQPTLLNTRIPASLNAIITKSLSPLPENRYHSVTEVISEINKFRQGFSTYAENAGFIKELQLFFKRNRSNCIIILLFFIVTIGTTSAFIINLNASKEHERAAKQKAQQSLLLYKTEKSARADLASDYSRTIASGSSFLDSKMFFYNPARAIKQAETEILQLLTHQKGNPQLLTQLAYVEFIQQNHTEVVKLISEHNLKNQEPLLNICNKFKLSTDNISPVNTFAALVRDLKKYKIDPALAIKLVSFDHFKRHSRHRYRKGYEQVVLALLEFYNTSWTTPSFNYIKDQKTLELSGKGLKRLALFWKGDDRSFLRFIPIHHLAINNCGFYDLTHLRGLKLKTLNIAGTKVKQLESLSTMKSLNKLIIRKGQLNSGQKAFLLKKVQVTELNSGQ